MHAHLPDVTIMMLFGLHCWGTAEKVSRFMLVSHHCRELLRLCRLLIRKLRWTKRELSMIERFLIDRNG
jgi:hypothetical protein